MAVDMGSAKNSHERLTYSFILYYGYRLCCRSVVSLTCISLTYGDSDRRTPSMITKSNLPNLIL